MSVKHVINYYNQIEAQYNEMLENLKDMQDLVDSEQVTEEFVQNLKNSIAPLKENYERWSYMLYLLNMPERKEKLAGYKQRSKKFLSKLSSHNSLEAVKTQNEEVIKNTKAKS